MNWLQDVIDKLYIARLTLDKVHLILQTLYHWIIRIHTMIGNLHHVIPGVGTNADQTVFHQIMTPTDRGVTLGNLVSL